MSHATPEIIANASTREKKIPAKTVRLALDAPVGMGNTDSGHATVIPLLQNVEVQAQLPPQSPAVLDVVGDALIPASALI
jgi:hypothetical protein